MLFNMESLKVCLFIVLVNLGINSVFCQLNETTNQTNESEGKSNNHELFESEIQLNFQIISFIRFRNSFG